MGSVNCAIDRCPRPYYGKGFCNMHYQRWRRTSDPLKVRKSSGGALTEEELTASLLARFHAGVDTSAGGPNGCWPWTGAVGSAGYGVIGRGSGKGNIRATHRLALELATGSDGGGLFALHSCDNRVCCNPAHLRWGTQADNVSDAFKRGRR